MIEAQDNRETSGGWIDAADRLPEIGRNGRSDLVQFKAGDAVLLGRLVREEDGLYWWNRADGGSQVPELKPKGIAPHRFVTRWRPAREGE